MRWISFDKLIGRKFEWRTIALWIFEFLSIFPDFVAEKTWQVFLGHRVTTFIHWSLKVECSSILLHSLTTYRLYFCIHFRTAIRQVCRPVFQFAFRSFSVKLFAVRFSPFFFHVLKGIPIFRQSDPWFISDTTDSELPGTSYQDGLQKPKKELIPVTLVKCVIYESCRSLALIYKVCQVEWRDPDLFTVLDKKHCFSFNKTLPLDSGPSIVPVCPRCSLTDVEKMMISPR